MTFQIPVEHLFTLRLEQLNRHGHDYVGPFGRRRFEKAVGGSVHGAALDGRVLELLASDYGRVSEDGAIRAYNASVTLQAQDGTVILMQYRGRSSPAYGPGQSRIQVLFQAPEGPYGWLNGLQAIGHGQEAGDATVFEIYALTADYLFGHDLSAAVRKFVKAHDGTIIGDELVATDVTDFSPYLLKIRQARPDVVACNLAGNQVTNFVKQYAEFGLQYPIAGFNLNTADAWAAGPGNLSGIWPTVWHHKLQTPGTQAFVAEFTKKYNKIPENHAWIEYISLKILAQAITETQSTDTDKLIAYLESGAEFDILKARKAYFRPWDHQLMQEAYPFTVMPADQVKGPQDFLVFGDPVPAADQSLEVLAPPKSENTCVM